MSLAVNVGGVASLQTKSDLKALIEQYMERDYTTEVDDFTRLVEARLNRELRGPDMEAIAESTLTSGSAPQPSDFLEARRVSNSGKTLDYISPEELINFRSANYPQIDHFSVVGSDIVVVPESAGTLSILYWKQIPGLSDGSPTNWVLSNHPDLYFAGCMHEACADVKDENAGLWYEKYSRILEDVKAYLVSKSIAGPLRSKPINQPWGARI